MFAAEVVGGHEGERQDGFVQVPAQGYPVTVLVGEQDIVEPPQVLRDHLLPHLAHVRLITVPGAGHLLPLEAPEAVATALVEFTAELGRRPRSRRIPASGTVHPNGS